ncbi:4-(cytidine 5'-diphospho)-2-C-methyl-D-erythritol kinase [uncultured Roseibium sp.]|uniref:4-(cytidine 5'-diphospho)-2-C-methyl-D-erythritol kinase n=1 Tax=uncultured Roseibium sp. TaxID=1936171 RepID=UPI00263298AB|nr:4-(cytidine 5'-diphospho)-2-C-methyl-D-erythritol kinase [uncultured Roseibium sp.]
MTLGSASMPRAGLARAKVNLALHITGQREDGYHLLHSFAVFPQIGDRIALEADDRLNLVLDGPFSRELEGSSDNNLILKAVKGFAEKASIPVPAVRLTLTKRLPVASGIGGGSSDAATTLRLLEDFSGVYLSEETMQGLALSLGADVPVCLFPEPQIMRGIGDVLSQGPSLPNCTIVLANPKKNVSTPEVFKTMTERHNAAMPIMPEKFETLGELTSYLSVCRNDMQDAAITLCPDIGDVLRALDGNELIEFARMSGSGATCFGLCETRNAVEIERSLRSAHPDWWIASGPLK